VDCVVAGFVVIDDNRLQRDHCVALGAGELGSEIQASMESVIIFGLISSTALSMLVISAA
jgi:multidrug efflux pump subunit AcrB